MFSLWMAGFELGVHFALREPGVARRGVPGRDRLLQPLLRHRGLDDPRAAEEHDGGADLVLCERELGLLVSRMADEATDPKQR